VFFFLLFLFFLLLGSLGALGGGELVKFVLYSFDEAFLLGKSALCCESMKAKK